MCRAESYLFNTIGGAIGLLASLYHVGPLAVSCVRIASQELVFDAGQNNIQCAVCCTPFGVLSNGPWIDSLGDTQVSGRVLNVP